MMYRAVVIYTVVTCLLFSVSGLQQHAQPYAKDTVRFLVIGDWGGLPLFPYRTPIESAIATRLADAANKYKAEFILALGDNFYFDGVKDIEDPRFQETYNHVFSSSSCDLDWYLVAGNHDHNGNVSAQIEYSKLVKRWNFPNYYYSLLYKIPGTTSTLEILMTDSIQLCGNSDHDFMLKQPMGPENVQVAEEQWQWIENKLRTSKSKYLIVTGHFPVYSIAEHGPTHCLVQRMMPLLHKYNVTAYFSGHDHNLQHLQTSDYNHTVDYFISGAANFVDPSKFHVNDVPKGSSKFHWANIFSLGGLALTEASPQNMTFTFIESNGKILYKHTMKPRV